jgi:mRNA-degrading endonuclease RelE of RelBE toxin-antitoxin system
MPRWNMRFEPPPGERKSPADYIDGLDDPKDKALIYRHLRMIQNLEFIDWSVKPITRRKTSIYQLTVGNFRVYLDFKDDKIVIFHVCRKVGQKAKKEDLNIAFSNYQNFTNKIKKK